MAQAQILMQNVGGNEEETDDQDGDREEEESLCTSMTDRAPTTDLKATTTG